MHCDLKSSNIMITPEFNVKITDFGLAKLTCLHKPFKGRIGTTHWMAPEVMRGETFSESSDVYSYGAILWEMITGNIPYGELSSMQIIGTVGYNGKNLPETSSDLAKICSMCLNHNPVLRPNFKDIICFIEDILGNTEDCQCCELAYTN